MKTERNITAAELAERNGIRIGTLEKRFRKCFPSERWSRNAELTPEQAERLLSVSGTERKSGTQKARPVTRNLAAHTERPVLLSVPERAEPIAVSAEPEPDATTQDRRVLLCRWLLWSITACQVFLVFVGCIFRFGGRCIVAKNTRRPSTPISSCGGAGRHCGRFLGRQCGCRL